MFTFELNTFVNPDTAGVPTPTTNTSCGSAFGPNVKRVVNAEKSTVPLPSRSTWTLNCTSVAGVAQSPCVETPKYTVVPFRAAPAYWTSAPRASSETPVPSVALPDVIPSSNALTFER